MENRENFSRSKKTENTLELLENWSKQEAPAFFETRLFARIENYTSPKVKVLQWSVLSLLVVVNAVFLFRNVQSQKASSQTSYTEYLESSGQIINQYNYTR